MSGDPVARPVAVDRLLADHGRPLQLRCGRFGVERLGFFGSILRDDFESTNSDLDLVVDFGPDPHDSPARQYVNFKAELERLLGRPVDLVELSAMQESRLKRIIQRTQVGIYGYGT
jgi:predicted nucleotidyltransferase